MAMRGWRGAIARWLFALAMPMAALGFTLALGGTIDQVPGPPFVAAIFAVAWFSGFRPALLSIALSVLALDYFFLPPRFTILTRPPELVWLALFCTTTTLVAWLVASRGRAQARVAANVEHLRVITDAAPVLIYYVDRARRYRFANRAFAERHGRTASDVVGRRVDEVAGRERADEIEPYLAAALDGRPSTVETTAHDPDGTTRHLQATYVPDAADGKVRGVIAVISDLSEIRRAEAERARLLDLEQRRRREAEAIAELGRLLTQGLDLDAVAERIAELSRGLLGGVAAAAYRLDESGALVSLAISGDMGEFKPGGVLPAGAGLAGLAVARGGPVTSANVLEDPEVLLPPETRRWVEQAPYRAVLAVPFKVKGRIVGAFAMGDRLGRVFGPDDVRLAEAFADHAAVALENARLYSEAESRRREAVMLADLVQAVNASLDLDTVLGRVAIAAKELCGADLARIALWDTAREGMVFRYTVGTRVAGHEQVLLTPGQGLAGEVLATGQPARTSNILADPRLHPVYAGMVRAEGSVAVVVAPIRMGDRIEGLIYCDNRAPRPFTERDEDVLLGLADHAAIALRNARLFAGAQAARREAETRARRARLLADVSRALAASSDYETTLPAVARLAVPTHADWCVVHLGRRDGSIRRVAVAHADPNHASLAAEMLSLPPSTDWREAGPALETLAAGRSVLLAEATAERIQELIGDPGDRRVYLALAPPSILIVPLVARGRPLGSITWLQGRARDPYTSEDVALAEDIAARCALAVDSARLYRQAERAREEAETANRAKDEFLAVLSHELRTPLTSMLGWLRLLRAGQLAPERSAQALEVVERNTRTQAQLINDLLDVSRIIAGKLQLDRYEVELAPIVEEMVESSRSEAEAKDVRLEIGADAGSVAVLGDPLRLGQIVINLVTNAVKFTPAGGRVRVRLSHEGGEAVVTVTDTGIGIDPTLLPQIFDRFRQADSTITRRHGGLGLGLAIVRHLSELHGGRVSAESEGPGQGATFVVRLPVVTRSGSRGRGTPVVAPTPPGATGRATLAGVRVLVAEDHGDTADLMRTVLQDHGAVVRVVDSIGGALAALAESEVDVLVSDIAMPDGNGYDLMARLRECSARRETPPAVAVTAFAGADDRERALAAGFQAWAAKPIDPAVLIEAVGRAASARLAR